MKGRHITILLAIIAINLTVISLDRVVDRFIPDAMAAYHIQKVAICDFDNPDKCASIRWGDLRVWNVDLTGIS